MGKTRTKRGRGRSKVFVKSVTIRNFKSIKSLKLSLKPGINVLIGPNASGKTNILEAIHFLYHSLVRGAGSIPYAPHIPRYWSPLDIIYLKDPENPVELGVECEQYLLTELNKGLSYFKLSTEYLITFNYDSVLDTLVPTKFSLNVNQGDYELVVTKGELVIRYREDIIKEAREKVTNDRGKLLSDILEEIQGGAVIKGNYYELVQKFESPSGPGILNALVSLTRPLVRMVFLHSIGEVTYLYGSLLHPAVGEINFILKARRAGTARGITLPEASIPLPPQILMEVLSRITLLRHPDIGAVREPKPIVGNDKLDERATNLAPTLLSIQARRGGFPERILYAFSRLFPELRIRVDAKFGRAVIVAEEDGLELPPPNMPDGVIKLLAILTAIELNPSLLLIDELENSMHARMLEFVVDELNSLEIPVLIATHSPIVTDLVGPERVILVSRDPAEGTKAVTIKRTEELRKKLEEYGVSLSDYVFYGLKE